MIICHNFANHHLLNYPGVHAVHAHMKKSNYQIDIQVAGAINKQVICQADYQSIYDVMTLYLYELLHCYIVNSQ